MRRILVILCIFAVLAAGCVQGYNTYISDENLPQLRAKWKQKYDAWKALDIQDYQFTWIWKLDYPPAGRIITVKNGIVVESVTEKESIPDIDLTGLPTIDTFFNMIFEAFDRDEKNGQKNVNDTGILGVKFYVTYNHSYHFPASFIEKKIMPKDYKLDAGENNDFEILIKDFKPLDD